MDIIIGLIYFIGAIASIIALVYAFSVTSGNEKSNITKAKEIINDKLMLLVSNKNSFDSIDVLAIIRSTLRKHGIRENKISPYSIIEDFISIVNGSLLIPLDSRKEVINQLKSLIIGKDNIETDNIEKINYEQNDNKFKGCTNEAVMKKDVTYRFHFYKKVYSKLSILLIMILLLCIPAFLIAFIGTRLDIFYLDNHFNLILIFLSLISLIMSMVYIAYGIFNKR